MDWKTAYLYFCVYDYNCGTRNLKLLRMLIHRIIDTREKPGLETSDVTHIQKYGVTSYALVGTSGIRGCLETVTKEQEMGTFPPNANKRD